MAGFRDFQTGEVLTAANVNDFLMQQSVMKFADAAARDTALGTAVGGSNALREGMVAYLDDTDEVLAYDGTAWGSLGLPLGTATPTDGQILAYGTATSTWNPTDQLAGIGSNVAYAVTSATFTTASSTFEDWTNMAVTITPSSATAKVLLIATAPSASNTGTNSFEMRFVRGASTGVYGQALSQLADANGINSPASLMALDSPATTSATTYKVQVETSGGTQSFFRGNLIAIEVAA